jgi:D-alanyl-D-alanine carboxypeptidase (penicillin-binding protein 5/6)
MFRRLHLALIILLAAALPVRAFETQATAAWVYDMTTQTVLMDKNGDMPVPPASMSKLMTINMLFEALRDGRVTMDTAFAVSDRAVQMTRAGGSTMMLQHNDRPTVRDLIPAWWSIPAMTPASWWPRGWPAPKTPLPGR